MAYHKFYGLMFMLGVIIRFDVYKSDKKDQ